MMDIALILDELVPAAKYGGVPGTTEATYARLRWNDARPKPSWVELEAAWPILLRSVKLRQVQGLRDELLAELDSRMLRALEQITMISEGWIGNPDDDPDTRKVLRVYRQELRDLPKTVTTELAVLTDPAKIETYQPTWPIRSV